MNATTSPPAPVTPDRIREAARALGILNGDARSAPRILAALCQDGASPKDIARLIGQDPGLTVRVLRVANSAFYGVPRAIATIDRAVVVLGLDAVRGIAAAACLDRSVTRGAESSLLDMAQFLRHSLATAAAAESLARIGHRELAPEAFIGGLLHDLGAVVQLRLDPAGLAKVAAAARAEPGTPLPEIEARHAQVGHEACARVLFEAWNLPAGLVACAGYHHLPQAAPPGHDLLLAMVRLGDQVAVGAGMGFCAEIEAGETEPGALDRLGLTTDQLQAAAVALPERLGALQGALAA